MTAAAPVIGDELRALLNSAYSIGRDLGRPFDAADLSVMAPYHQLLMQAAVAYANSCDASWSDWLAQRQRQVRGGGFLTGRDAKGILNCLMAQARRNLAERTADRPAPRFAGIDKLRPSRYRVELPNGTLAVRIEPAHEERKGLAILTRLEDSWLFQGTVSLSGVPDLMRRAPALLPAALDVLIKADDALVYGLAYAMEGNECAFCGRDLDTAESISVGYGPKCADKHGLPWGDKAIPAKVLLARAQATRSGVTSAPIVAPVAAVPVAGRARTYAEIFGDEDEAAA